MKGICLIKNVVSGSKDPLKIVSECETNTSYREKDINKKRGDGK